MPHRTLPSGTLLARRYQVDRLIKSGGFAAVYVAVDLSQQLRCAVKETFDPSDEGAEQFRLEAAILADVRHANLPAVWDYFQHAGGLYLVMEYVEGDDLESRLEVEDFLPEPLVVDWAIQMCDALAALHNHQPPIIHRDIKPANVKITPEGRAVLVDFGIAKLFQAGSNTQVAARAVTDGFSPLEQYGQGSTDARSDVYALGATIYNLLTNVIPPDAPSRVTDDKLVPPRRYQPTISPLLEQVTMRALSLRPQDRFQTAEELRRALVAVERQGVLRPTGNLASPGQLTPTGQLGPREEPPAPGEWWCASCNARNPLGNAYCLECGAPAPTIEIPLPTRIIAPPPQPAPEEPVLVSRAVPLARSLRGWEAMPGPAGGVLRAVAGRSGQGMVACGERGLVLVYNNGAWVSLPTPTSYILSAVAAGTGHVWAVGEHGVVVHFTGGRWSVLRGEVDEHLTAIALDDPTSGWIAGADGALLELRDLALMPQPRRSRRIRSLAIDDVGEGWAVGDDSLLLRLRQGAWKARSTSAVWGDLRGVGHVAPGAAWAVGAGGVLLHLDDTGWQIGPTLGLPDLYAVAFNRRGEGWAVGDLGALAWYDGQEWTVPAAPAPLPIALHSVAWLHDDEAWAIGDHGVVLRWRR